MLAADWSLYDLLALGLGYLLGSIPFGLILTRLAGHGDVRDIGSGNIGATNVLRTGNKKLAALTLILDALKGTAAVLIGARFGQDAAILGGLGAFLGHLFPVWLGFRGGKGVACALGAVLAVEPWVGLGALVVFGLAKTVVPFVGEASVVTLLGIWLVGLLGLVGGAPFVGPLVGGWLLLMCTLVLSRHRRNILAWWGRHVR